MTAEERDQRAAEYVLGTLPEEERLAAAALVQSDPPFARSVEAWERRFAPLDAETAPVAPPARLWRRIEAEIEREAAVPRVDPRQRLADAAGPADVVDIRRRLRRWRRIAVAAGALAAGLAGVIVYDRLPLLFGGQGGRYVAVVNRDASLPALIVDVDTLRGSVTVRPVAAERPEGKSLELWVVPDGFAPRSLGLVDPGAPVTRIARERAGPLPAKGVIAVSVEPPGGSPTGSPTGPVIYSGALIPAED